MNVDFSVADMAFAILFAAGGWWARTLWTLVQKTRDELAEHKTHVAATYTPAARFDATILRVEGKLDRVIDILSHKADRE